MPDHAMARILGLRDKAGDGSPVRKIRARKTGLTGPTRLCLAYALKHGPMTHEDERAQITGLGVEGV